jgi:hypothetical protein
MAKNLSPACEVRPADQAFKQSQSHAEPAWKILATDK